MLGYGLGALSKPLFAIATHSSMVLSARLIDRVGKGIRGAPRDAMIADIAPAHLRGAAFGLRQSLDTVGAFMGPLLAVGLLILTTNDFRIGGGIILLLIALSDLVFSQNIRSRNPDGKVGIVPLGSPLIIGPAALTTILASVDRFGYVTTIVSLIFNLWFVYFIFHHSQYVVKHIGKGGTHAIGKIFSLFLCANAVTMIRLGMTYFLTNQN